MASNHTELRLTAVEAGYGRQPVLRGVDVSVAGGELVALVGPNAAGKTTLLRTVIGFLKPSAGEVRLDGRDLRRRSACQRVRDGIGYVPEGGQVFADLSVRDNLHLGGHLLGSHHDVELAVDRVVSIFPVLKARLAQRAGTLSGGERQMLAVGRALMLRPRLLLLDEPTVGLAPQPADTLLRRLGMLRDQDGIGMLVVEQRLRSVFRLANRAYVLSRGRIASEIAAPDPDHLPTELDTVYLGSAHRNVR